MTDCRHHWLIEAPEGPTSEAHCKLCGAEREFQNVMPWQERHAKLSRAESVDLQRQLMMAVHQAGDDGEHVT